MSKIDDLIKELCPEGVEFKRLGEICEIKTGAGVTRKDVVEEGLFPIISGGVYPLGMYNRSNRKAKTVTIARAGSAGYVDFIDKDFYLNDKCFSAIPFKVYQDNIDSRFLYFALKNIEQSIMDMKSTGSVPTVNTQKVSKIKIPIPPLEVQREIVHMLDSFTELEVELEAELEARKKQYEYYRNTLLTFGDSVAWKPMGEVGELIRGNGLQKKDFTEDGFPCIHYGQLYTYYSSEATDTKSFTSEEVFQKLKKALRGDVLIAGTSENINDVCKPCYWNGHETIGVSGDMFIFRPNKDISGKYLTYVLQSDNFMTYKRRYVTGTKVIRLSADSLKRFKIPVPSLEKQKKIVSILDKFEKLTNDISIGLPAEIEARRKQYEYYRNKLLTFKELECSR